MEKLHIITPVKNSLESSLLTIQSVMKTRIKVPYTYTVFNDFSTAEVTVELRKYAQEMGFDLVNLSDFTTHPSPNYLLTLQMAQEKANKEGAALCLVESDVIVEPCTLQSLYEASLWLPKCGIAASVTVNDKGERNYPYRYARKFPLGIVEVEKHCSFCCSLLTPTLLKSINFKTLDEGKNWFDVTISHESRQMGLRNYLFTGLPVVHRPHQSRPWKQLKYTNPLKYYWEKYTKGMDKI